MNGVYPLGHAADEIERLDAQAALLRDPFLERLAAGSRNCLEIGCGAGSNLGLLREANPGLQYAGIDSAPEAISAAQARFGSDGLSSFQVMDGACPTLDGGFDLVFTKLVLWSVGANWTGVLKEAHRLLRPGGVFYALEPCNQLIQFHPPKPAAEAWMKRWDEAASERGLDSFIGMKVAGELCKAGFAGVGAEFRPIVAMGSDRPRYEAVAGNLKGFYLGPASVRFGLDASSAQGRQASDAFDSRRPENLVMDALFASWGTRP